ncbi:toprim domain-containing protein [Staphylococcus succinus]|uniref:toprim domain-containing protein n=1 Tax=Staphylococcus succinus TaxID=61015 RepID=UPI002DBFFB44|nr:toprim domain-containing protein [Staphylococcus succinus]MEB8125297.1 toprim domain-containing protein [Staphylococcus succinus]
MTLLNQVIVVEGKSDKKRVKQVIDQPIDIICTNGTMGVGKLDEMIESLYDKQVFILVDSDREGEKIRKWFKRYLSESRHIRIDKQYCEVARYPKPYLSRVLSKHGFAVKDEEKVAKAKLDYIAERVSLLT